MTGRGTRISCLGHCLFDDDFGGLDDFDDLFFHDSQGLGWDLCICLAEESCGE